MAGLAMVLKFIDAALVVVEPSKRITLQKLNARENATLHAVELGLKAVDSYGQAGRGIVNDFGHDSGYLAEIVGS
jgi:hypothetical protein